MQKYKIETNQYSENILIPSNCNSITFLNVGANVVLINNINLSAGSSLAIQGNQLELDVTEYRIDFGTAATSGNLVQVIQKINF